MENNRLEILVSEYLNSVVGSNPTLSVLRKKVGFARGLNEHLYQEVFYVNGIRVGSKSHGTKKISMDKELYDKTRKLFCLNNTLTSMYFKDWLSKVKSNEEINIRISKQ